MTTPFLPGLTLAVCLWLAPAPFCAGQPPPFALPKPQPAPTLAPLSLPPAVGFRSQPPTAGEIERVIPKIEIWRPGSNVPQLPNGRFQKSRRLVSVLLAGDQPVMVRLRFHPLSKGKMVLARAARGVSLHPAEETFRIPVDGQFVLSLSLHPGMTESHVSFTCEGLTTTLVLTRTSVDNVSARENAAPEAGQ